MRHWSEEIARDYLLAQGFELLAENYAVRGGEIDLVLKDGAVTVFAEVRQRGSSRYGDAAASISPAKLARLRRAALHYLVKAYGRDDVPVRFDAVLLDGPRQNYRLQHLRNIG